MPQASTATLTQHLQTTNLLIAANNFAQVSWTNAGARGDTLLDLTDPQNPRLLLSGLHLIQFRPATIDYPTGPTPSKPNALWAADIAVGWLVDQVYYPFADTSDVKINGTQVGTAQVFASCRAGTSIQCYVYNGDSNIHQWHNLELYVSLIPNARSFIVPFIP